MKTRNALSLLLSVSGLLLIPSGATSWNKAGHMVTGAIAYQLLQEDAETLDSIVLLLKAHPEYETRFLPMLNRDFVQEKERDLYLFMLAARWADDVRENQDFDEPKWHYINLPYSVGGVTAEREDRNNLRAALNRNRRTALDRSASKENRAVAVTWLFHLVGDVHQPLHTARLFSRKFPRGDRGGTRFYVKVRGRSSTTSLHTLWDGFVIGSSRLGSIRNKAIELRSREEFSPDQLAGEEIQDMERWIEESFELAKKEAYRGGDLAGSDDRDDGAVLPQGYAGSNKRIAERRIVLASYRLAQLLREISGDGEQE